MARGKTTAVRKRLNIEIVKNMKTVQGNFLWKLFTFQPNIYTCMQTYVDYIVNNEVNTVFV